MYLFFLIYIRRKSPDIMTMNERYIFMKMWPHDEEEGRSFNWLPREETFTLKKREVDRD